MTPSTCSAQKNTGGQIDDNDVKWGVVAKKLIRMTLIYDLGDEVGRQKF